MYLLARIKGVPANRLLIMAGGVLAGDGASQGGHAWLGYRPTYYPLNWVFLDWCYYPDISDIENKEIYTIDGKTITDSMGETIIYQRIWFAFNEDVSFRELRTKNKY
jgi:hypothetical protein